MFGSLLPGARRTRDQVIYDGERNSLSVQTIQEEVRRSNLLFGYCLDILFVGNINLLNQQDDSYYLQLLSIHQVEVGSFWLIEINKSNLKRFFRIRHSRKQTQGGGMRKRRGSFPKGEESKPYGV